MTLKATLYLKKQELDRVQKEYRELKDVYDKEIANKRKLDKKADDMRKAAGEEGFHELILKFTEILSRTGRDQEDGTKTNDIGTYIINFELVTNDMLIEAATEIGATTINNMYKIKSQNTRHAKNIMKKFWVKMERTEVKAIFHEASWDMGYKGNRFDD